MTRPAPFRRLRALTVDVTGGALVEFALLAPVFIAMVIGVLQIGTYMQNYSAVRSLASDAARFTAVEYQKSNTLSTTELEADIVAMGAASPYNLSGDRLQVNLTEVSPSDVDGSRKFDMDITYQIPSFMAGIGFNDFTLDYSRPLYVIG
jgi:Flp pilus assembly protein TadG